jgi:Zn-dependent protease
MQDDQSPLAPPVVVRVSSGPPPVVVPPDAMTRQPADLEMRVHPPKRPGWLRRLLAPLAVAGATLAKFKGILFIGAKYFFVLLKTGGSMLFMAWVYARYYGWPFAAGFVLLIFIHECGHLLMARKLGLRVGAPMFIPFVGALITMKESPRNAWVEAQVAIGGPLLGSLGAGVCLSIYALTGQPLYAGLAYFGFMINLFNLTPIGFLDGGRIVTALSPWMWLGGLIIMVSMALSGSSPIIWFILLFSLPRLFSLFRAKTEAEKRYFEVTPAQRWIMGTLYFGLAAALAPGMWFAQSAMEAARHLAPAVAV